jgi:4-amino-4-deoxy-L-arabinose transferase-like glycosyltransferase
VRGRLASRRAAIVFAAALAFRVAYLLWTASGWHVIPGTILTKSYFWQGYGIAAGYGYVSAEGPVRRHLIALARRVESEGGRVTPESAGPMEVEGARPETLHPPGMALLVAGINRLLGMPADVPIQILFLVADSIAALLVFWTGNLAFGSRVGFAAGLAYAFFPPSAYTAVAWPPTGFLPIFIVGSLACVLHGLRRGAKRRWGWYAASGVLLGVGGYFRPDYVLMPGFVGLGLWAHTRRFWDSLGAMALAQIIVFVVLLPWAYRNHTVYGPWIFTSTSAGGTMINGLGAFPNPWGYGPRDQDRHAQAAAVGIESAWSPAGDVYFRRLFVSSIMEHPGGYLMSLLYKLPAGIATPYDLGFKNPWRTQTFYVARKEGQDRYQFIRDRPGYFLAAYSDRVATAFMSLLCLASVVFMAIAERRRLGLILLLLSPHLYSIIAHIAVSHMQPYYLIPSVFCWLLGLGYVLGRGWREPVPERILAERTR